jgi:WXXGXW repeat (2 copies)
LTVKKKTLALLLAFSLLSSGLFAFDNPPREAPPPHATETPGPNPHPGFVWKGGYYKWTGHHYRWSMGHWVNPPRPGGVWEPGTWVKNGDHWEYKDGHWKY